jgi:acyl carrier protein
MRTELGILQDYIRLETGYEGEVTSDADLLRTHILDSFSIVQLAMFVQERFGIELEAEDLVRDNLSTLSRVIALIQKKKNTGLANSEPRM